MGYENPGKGAGDSRFKVLGKTSAASEPSEGTLDDPAARQNDEAFRQIGSFDDFDRPFAFTGECLSKFLAGVAAVGEDVAQPWIEKAD